MSIASELMRLLNLRRELTTILVDKSIISSGNHDLEDDVVAVEALNYSYQSKTTTLGSSAPQTVTPDTGYTGLSRVNVLVSGITGSKIVQGHKILGVNGTAQSVINLKKVYWTVTVNNVSSITVQSSAASCYPAGSFTPGNALPNVQSINNDKELIVFRKARPSGNISYNEVNFGIEAFDQGGAVYMQTINTGPTLQYPVSYTMSVSMNSSLTSITISVSGNYRFNGTYLIQVAYI